MSKTIEIDGYTYTLPFTVDDANNDLVDANGGYFGMHSVSPAELVTIAAALNDYRPWRYPNRGEFPKGDNYWVEVSFAEYDDGITLSYIDHLVWKDGGFYEENGTCRPDVYAFRELPDPAPVIEEEKA